MKELIILVSAMSVICLFLHGLLHLIATRWKTNVFHSLDSFIFVSGAAFSGVINLCLVGFCT